MAATFTPNASPLIIAQEDEQSVVGVITVDADPLTMDEFISLDYTTDFPLPAQAIVLVHVGASNASLTLTFPDFIDVFPIIAIRYLDKKVPGTCIKWIDLPADAEDVLQFRPFPENMKEIMLSVSAKFKSGEVEEKVYVIQIFRNFTIGRDLLIDAVNARR